MNCSEAERLFDPYLDGELSGSLRLEFDAHRLRCTLCQRKLAMMEACEQLMAGDSRVPSLSTDFTDRLMARIAEQTITPRRPQWRPMRITLAVGLQAAAVIGFVLIWPALRSTPVAETPGITLQDIVTEQGDPGVGNFMLRGVENVWAARSNIADDVGALPRYAMSLALAGDRRDVNWLESLHWLFDFVPIGEDGDSTDGEDASDTISL